MPGSRSVVATLFSYRPVTGKLRSTAWLDGLRGLAALEVVLYHYAELWGKIDVGYAPGTGTILHLPLIRALYDSGAAMVCLFFVISGLVLTQRVLRALQMHEHESAYTFLSSSVFRRGLRLFPPAIAAAFLAFLLFRLFGIRPYGTTEENLPYYDSVFRQFRNFLGETIQYVNVFELNLRDGFTIEHGHFRFLGHTYANVTWTIPVEFYGSMACYLELLGTARFQPRTRNIIIAGISVWALLVARWVLFCFNAGILLAEYIMHQDRRPEPQKRSEVILWSFLFIAGIWIAGCPDRGPKTGDNPSLGFNTLWRLFPESYLELNFNYTIWSFGGILIAYSASQLSKVQRFLETGFCQYLGKISFSMYLLHIIVRDVIGYKLQKVLLRHASPDFDSEHSGVESIDPAISTLVRYSACVVWFLITLIVVFISSGIFEKVIDAPLIKMSKWLEMKALPSVQHEATETVELESQRVHDREASS